MGEGRKRTLLPDSAAHKTEKAPATCLKQLQVLLNPRSSMILDGTGSPAELLNSMRHSSAEAQPNPRLRGGGK